VGINEIYNESAGLIMLHQFRRIMGFYTRGYIIDGLLIVVIDVGLTRPKGNIVPLVLYTPQEKSLIIDPGVLFPVPSRGYR
jgi:hypothetical protein